MRTWVLWTHYDCDVYATLHSTQLEAYEYLASGWLTECDEDDCGHTDFSDVENIADALEWHYDSMSYEVEEHEVPMQPLPAMGREKAVVREKKVMAPITVPDENAHNLMSRLEDFSHE